MQLDKSSPEALQFLTGLLSTLETIKKQLAGTEAITNEVRTCVSLGVVGEKVGWFR